MKRHKTAFKFSVSISLPHPGFFSVVFATNFIEYILILNDQSMNLKPQRVFCLQYFFPSSFETTIFSHFLFALFRLLAGEKKCPIQISILESILLWDINILYALSAVFAQSQNDFTVPHFFSLPHEFRNSCTILFLILRFQISISKYLKCLFCLVYACDELKLQVG